MTNALVRFITGDSGDDRRKANEIARAGEDYKGHLELQAFSSTGDARLAKLVMDQAVDVDQHRKHLAGDDEVLNHLLLPIEMAFIQQATKRVNGGSSLDMSHWRF